MLEKNVYAENKHPETINKELTELVTAQLTTCNRNKSGRKQQKIKKCGFLLNRN